MSRSWIRVSCRVFAVVLLVTGLATGWYLGVHHHNLTDSGDRVPDASASDRALDDLDRVSRDAARAARDHKARADAAARAERRARAASRDAAERAAAAEEALRAEQEEAEKPSSPMGPVPASCKAYNGNKRIGCTLLLEWDYQMDQMPCLDRLWEHESGWNEHAENPSSGAYGIPQALPGEKMSKYGDDWRDNPATQIKWGLDYIKGRYDDPCGALTYWRNNGWY